MPGLLVSDDQVEATRASEQRKPMLLVWWFICPLTLPPNFGFEISDLPQHPFAPLEEIRRSVCVCVMAREGQRARSPL